jgi:hypothetical protein
MAQKNIKKSLFIVASLLLSIVSFAGSIFSGSKSNNTAYADVSSPSAGDYPCPDPCCDTCVGDNDKLA